MRRWFELATVTLSMACTALVLELALFVFEPQLARYFQYDEELGFRVKPHSDFTNQFGFNDREYAPDKAPGTFRILFIGDSFGWQGGIHGNYTAILERRFDREFHAHRVDVINIGYSMTSTNEQLGVLRRYGMAYHPDLVVLGFFAGNDFVDADPNRKRIVLMDTYFDVDARRPPMTIFGRPIIAQSRLWTLLEQRCVLVRHLLAGTAPGTESGLSTEAYLPMTGGQMNFYNIHRHERGEFTAHITNTLRGIDLMHELVSSQGARFAVAILPADFSVHAERANTIVQHFNMNREDYDLSLAQTILARHLGSRGIPVRDLLPDFIELGGQRSLNLPMDGHWNRLGNAAAATLLHDWLLPEVKAFLSAGPAH